ncbi:MAG TPA: hypothetical protein VF167_01085 [Longimicrobiaceae bacterium]
MPDRSEKVQARVREELEKNPDATTKELQEAAKSVDASIGELSLRQFNAGYVLPLKRSGVGRGRKAKTGAGAAAGAAGGRRRGGRRRAAPQPSAEAPAPRRAARAPTAASTASGAADIDRDRVRNTLLEFARDFSDAESRAEIVGVLSNLDRYVDKIVRSRK